MVVTKEDVTKDEEKMEAILVIPVVKTRHLSLTMFFQDAGRGKRPSELEDNPLCIIRHRPCRPERTSIMGLREFFFGGPVQSSAEDLATAEEYLSSKCSEEHITALVRHYAVGEVTDDIERFAGVALNDQETAGIVQKLRDQHAMGPITAGNMTG